MTAITSSVLPLLNKCGWCCAAKPFLSRKQPKSSLLWLVEIRKLLDDVLQFEKKFLCIRARKCFTLVPARYGFRPRAQKVRYVH